jgi:predicted metal-dependent phosphoesterase TrpH
MNDSGLLRVDMHVHTDHSSDSRTRPADVVKRALELGMDAIAVTDHDTVSGALEAERKAKNTCLLVIPGQETRTREGEVIVLGLRKSLSSRQPLLHTLKQAKGEGGFVIVPHPFDIMRRGIGKSISRCLNYIDAIEVFNSRTMLNVFNKKAFAFAERHGLPMTTGSDSHSPGEMGKAFMLVKSKNNEGAIFNAIRSGNTELVTRRQGMPSGIKRGLFKIRTYF